MTTLATNWLTLATGFIFGGAIIGAIVHQIMDGKVKDLDEREDYWISQYYQLLEEYGKEEANQ